MNSVLKIMYSRKEKIGNSPIKEESIMSIDNPSSPDECVNLFEIMLRNIFDNSSIRLEMVGTGTPANDEDCGDEDGEGFFTGSTTNLTWDGINAYSTAPVQENQKPPTQIGCDWGLPECLPFEPDSDTLEPSSFHKE